MWMKEMALPKEILHWKSEIVFFKDQYQDQFCFNRQVMTLTQGVKKSW